MAHFSADKQALQKTLAVFDTDIKVEDVVGYSPMYESCKTTDMLFLQTILEVCCSFVEPNPNRRKHLFTVLEALLVREKIINPNVRFESLTDIRRNSAKQFLISLYELRSSLIPSPNDSISIPKLLDVDHAKKFPNTYEENFVELSVIAEGGFGTVCKARHKVDGLIYAVKKIIFNVEREKDFTKVMAEVKSISTLSHKNIVSYKNCWIQLPCNLEERTGVAEEDSSGNLHSVARKFDGMRLRQRKGKPKCVTLLNFVPNATSSPCYENPKSSEESLLQRVLKNSTHNRRVSVSCTNKSPESHINSEFDRSIDIFSKSENDCSIACDSPSGGLAQGLVSAGPDVIITNSSSDNTTASADSWVSCLEDNKTELDQRNFWNTSPSNWVSKINKVFNKNLLSSPFTNSWGDNSLHDQTLRSDDGILFSDSYRTDSSHDLVSASGAPSSPLSESNNETLSPDSTDSDPVDNEESSESERTQSGSSENDSGSTRNSVSLNGDFSERATVSRCNTSCVTTWSTRSQRQSRLNDSIVCYDSTKAASLEYPFKFKNKFRPMLCIQMEYCDCDLRLWMDQRNNGDCLPFQKEIKDIFKEIVEGVAYIHSKSIIHRDLKPQNIFYSEKDNSMKIGDFGLATLGNSSPNRHKIVNQHFTSDLGTLPYAAPEQMRKHDYDNKVDIYSLGIILIELLLPFQTRSEFFQTIPQILRGEMPKGLISQWPSYVKLVENLVQKRPSLRMAAKEILDLPVMQNDAEVDRQSLIREIEDLKKALEDKDKELEDALNGKNAIIQSLRLEIKELSGIIKNLKSKKSRKKH